MSQSSSGNESDDNATANELVARIQRGDRKAFDELWETWEKRVFGHLLRIVNDHSLAEDLCQATSHKLYLYLCKVELPIISFNAVWTKVASNVAFDCFRKKKVSKKRMNLSYFDVVPETAEPTIDKSDAELLTELLAWVASAFCNLSDQEQRVISMRYGIEGEMTFKEIGDEIEVSRERAGQIHAEALKKLRDQFNKDRR